MKTKYILTNCNVLLSYPPKYEYLAVEVPMNYSNYHRELIFPTLSELVSSLFSRIETYKIFITDIKGKEFSIDFEKYKKDFKDLRIKVGQIRYNRFRNKKYIITKLQDNYINALFDTGEVLILTKEDTLKDKLLSEFQTILEGVTFLFNNIENNS